MVIGLDVWQARLKRAFLAAVADHRAFKPSGIGLRLTRDDALARLDNRLTRLIGWALAERELGARFDLKAFHQAVLGAGSLPLDLLETCVSP